MNNKQRNNGVKISEFEGVTCMRLPDGKLSFRREEDGFVFPGEFDIANDFCGGLALVSRNGLWWFVDKNGEKMGEEYQCAYDFREGFARVQIQNDWWFINKKGEKVAGPYYWIDNFSNGKARVFISPDFTESFEINTKGERI